MLSNSVLHVDKGHRYDYISLKSHRTGQQSQDFNLEFCRFKDLGDLSTGGAGTFSPLKRVLDIFLNWYDDTFLIEWTVKKMTQIVVVSVWSRDKRKTAFPINEKLLSIFCHFGLWLYLMSFVEMTWIQAEALCPINLTLSTWVSFTNTCMIRLAKISIHY